MQDIERTIKKLKENDCNMVDNVLNNGVGEKEQQETVKTEQEHSATRTSLKARPVGKWQK